MHYLVIEVQNDVVLPVIVKEKQAEAESAYHTILAAAAVSPVAVHTAILLNNKGFLLDSQCYEHMEEPENPEE